MTCLKCNQSYISSKMNVNLRNCHWFLICQINAQLFIIGTFVGLLLSACFSRKYIRQWGLCNDLPSWNTYLYSHHSLDIHLLWENYIFFSFQIEWDMIVVTVFLSILSQMEFHLVQKRKENCHHDHIPFNMKGIGSIVLSVWADLHPIIKGG